MKYYAPLVFSSKLREDTEAWILNNSGLVLQGAPKWDHEDPLIGGQNTICQNGVVCALQGLPEWDHEDPLIF